MLRAQGAECVISRRLQLSAGRPQFGPSQVSYPRAKSPGLVTLSALWRSCAAGSLPVATNGFATISSSLTPSFLQLQPELDKTADQICPRCLAIFLNGSRSVFALRRIAKLVRFRVLAMVSTLFALRTSARSSLSRSGVQGRRGVPVICPSPPSRRDRSVIVRRQANAVPRLKRAMRLRFAYTD
jgi:hypothetical protein